MDFFIIDLKIGLKMEYSSYNEFVSLIIWPY